MDQLIHLPKDSILREQVSLVRRNEPISILGFITASTITAYVIYYESQSTLIFIWLSAIIAISIPWVVIQILVPYQSMRSPRPEALSRIAMGVVYSLMWSWMTFTYLPQASPLILVSVSMITGAVCAGCVAIQSPCLPQCFSFSTISMGSVILALLLRNGQPLDVILAVGGTFFFVALMISMITMESTIRNSIELRFDKEALINQLRAALEQTEEANTAKSMFLASASHDLRQPIQALSLVAEAIKNTDLDDYQTKLYGHLKSAVDSTFGMLDSLLDFSKVDVGAIKVISKPFSVDDLFRQLESELKPLANKKNLEYRSRKTTAIAHSDPQIVGMILRNLVTNAIRYTERGGILVACRISPASKKILFEVWDTGIGVSTADKKIIFKEFRQVDTSDQKAKKGFGLGLAISQGLAKEIGTKITVQSRLGRGSVFRLMVTSSNETVVTDISESGGNKDLQGKTVLVVDDNERIRETMYTLLKSWGCHCSTAESTEQALSYVAHRKPDILLVDYRLQDEQTGTEAINTIRTFVGEDVPAVIITGDSATNYQSEIQGPPPQFMRKPVSALALKKMINSMV